MYQNGEKKLRSLGAYMEECGVDVKGNVCISMSVYHLYNATSNKINIEAETYIALLLK
jgi:hypothetical protein